MARAILMFLNNGKSKTKDETIAAMVFFIMSIKE